VARFVGVALALGCVAFAYAVAAPAHATRRKVTSTESKASTSRAKTSAKTSRAKTSRAKASRAKASRAKAKASRPKTSTGARSPARTAMTSSDEYLSHPGDAELAPAYRYARLSQADCEAELGSRQVDFIRETALGVEAPVRLTGRLRGVEFRSNASAKRRQTSPYEIVDCRLVLALDDFAQILSRHGIVEVRHYSMYRPPRRPSDAPYGKRHGAALAIDTGRFLYATGEELDVDKDFHGEIGAKTCGDGAVPDPATDAALALRAILCEAVERRLFTVVLTPNYDPPHKNHFHLEITPEVTWFLVH
jgi:hypothetical protein